MLKPKEDLIHTFNHKNLKVDPSQIWQMGPDDLKPGKKVKRALLSAQYWTRIYTESERVVGTFGIGVSRFNLETILEIGPSIGITSAELQELFPRAKLYGIDLNSEALIKARKQCPSADFLVGDGYCPQVYYPQHFFDGIFMMNNLAFAIEDQIMPVKEGRKILGYVQKVLRSGGYLFISADNQYAIFKCDEVPTVVEAITTGNPLIRRLIEAMDVELSTVVSKIKPKQRSFSI